MYMKFKRCWSMSLWILLAINLLGLAIICFLESELGCDPIALLSSGISSAADTSFGIASFFYNIATIGLACLLARRYLGAGTIVYGLLSGFVIDLYGLFFHSFLITADSVLSKAIFFLIGEICMATAFVILMHLNLGMTALDALLTSLSEKITVPYAVLKMASDAAFVVTGVFLGGAFGVGTIISVAVTGVLVTKIGTVIKGRVHIGNEEEDSHEKRALQI